MHALVLSRMRVCVLAQKSEEATASFASLLATPLAGGKSLQHITQLIYASVHWALFPPLHLNLLNSPASFSSYLTCPIFYIPPSTFSILPPLPQDMSWILEYSLSIQLLYTAPYFQLTYILPSLASYTLRSKERSDHAAPVELSPRNAITVLARHHAPFVCKPPPPPLLFA